jgi:hypothetical protein
MQHIMIGLGLFASVTGVFIAQVPTDGTSAVTSYEKLGALGALALIVVLIFIRYLPGKDKQSTEQITAFTKCIESITAANNAAIKEQRDSFKSTMDTVCKEFRESNERMTNLSLEIVGKCKANGIS